MTGAEILAVCAAVLVATVVQQVSGFGYALLAVPLASLAIGPKDAVAVAMATGFVSSGTMSYRLRVRVKRPELRRLLMGAVVGLPVGVYLLRIMSPDPLRVALSVVLLVMVGVLATGYRRASTAPSTEVGAGVVSGVLNGSLGTGGPPVIVLLQATDTEQHTFRATTTAFFAVCDLYAIPLLVLSGAVSGGAWVASLIAIPALFVGDAIGHRVAFRINRTHFRRLVLWLLVFTALVSLYSVVR